MEGVEALLFDVFGTVVDWHGSVTNELKAEGDKLLPGGTCVRTCNSPVLTLRVS